MMKKLLAVLSALALALSLTACGSKDNGETTTATEEPTSQSAVNTEDDTTLPDVTEDTSENGSGDTSETPSETITEIETVTGSDGKAVTDKNGKAVTEKVVVTTKKSGATTKAGSKSTTKATTKASGLNSSDKSVVVPYYVAAAKNTSKNVKVTKKKTVVSIDGGVLGMLEGPAKSAAEKKSGVENGIPGNYTKLTADDITSAKATSDGKYTTVEMKVKDYTASAYARTGEGSVGHAIGAIDTFQTVIDEIPGLTVEDQKNIKLKYTNAVVKVKIDNATNKIVSGNWDYDVAIQIRDSKGKFTIIPLDISSTDILLRYTAKL